MWEVKRTSATLKMKRWIDSKTWKRNSRTSWLIAHGGVEVTGKERQGPLQGDTSFLSLTSEWMEVLCVRSLEQKMRLSLPLSKVAIRPRKELDHRDCMCRGIPLSWSSREGKQHRNRKQIDGGQGLTSGQRTKYRGAVEKFKAREHRVKAKTWGENS